MPQFMIADIFESDKDIQIGGAVNLGQIEIGMVFDRIVDRSDPGGEVVVTPCELRVVEIEAYRKKLSCLPEGYSGKLVLEGEFVPGLVAWNLMEISDVDKTEETQQQKAGTQQRTGPSPN